MSYFKAIRWEDTDGTARGFKNVDGNPRVVSQTYLEQIAEGNVTGHTAWSKIGYTPTMTTAVSDVWSATGAYAFCTTAGIWEVVSSDNTQDIGTSIFSGTSTGGSTTTLIDTGKNFLGGTAVAVGDCVILDKSGTTPEWGYVTGVATTTLTISAGFSSGGTGSGRAYTIVDKSAYTNAQAVKIEYLTNTYASKSEIVLLNGTTAVDTVNNDLFRVNSFRIIAEGTSFGCKGNLTLRADGGGTTYSYITATFTRARNSVYTVPTGKTLYICQMPAGWALGNKATALDSCRFFLRANIEPSTNFNTLDIFYPQTELISNMSTISVNFPIPLKIPAKTDIRISGIATAAGSAIAEYRGWLE